MVTKHNMGPFRPDSGVVFLSMQISHKRVHMCSLSGCKSVSFSPQGHMALHWSLTKAFLVLLELIHHHCKNKTRTHCTSLRQSFCVFTLWADLIYIPLICHEAPPNFNIFTFIAFPPEYGCDLLCKCGLVCVQYYTKIIGRIVNSLERIIANSFAAFTRNTQ